MIVIPTACSMSVSLLMIATKTVFLTAVTFCLVDLTTVTSTRFPTSVNWTQIATTTASLTDVISPALLHKIAIPMASPMNAN